MPSLNQQDRDKEEKVRAARLKAAQLRRSETKKPKQHVSQPQDLSNMVISRGVDYAKNKLALQKNKNHSQKKDSLEKKTRRKIGVWLGSVIGAAIGSFILPGAGTWLGGIIGAFLGDQLAGSVVGKWLFWGIIAGTILQWMIIGTAILISVLIILSITDIDILSNSVTGLGYVGNLIANSAAHGVGQIGSVIVNGVSGVMNYAFGK